MGWKRANPAQRRTERRERGGASAYPGTSATARSKKDDDDTDPEDDDPRIVMLAAAIVMSAPTETAQNAAPKIATTKIVKTAQCNQTRTKPTTCAPAWPP